MPFGYIGQNQTKQQVKNSGVLSSFDISHLEKQGHAGGSLEHIITSTASSSTVDFVDKFNEFSVYFIQMINCVPTTQTEFGLKFSNDSGSSYETGTYHFANQRCFANGTFEDRRSQSQTSIRLGGDVETSDSFNSYIYIYNANSSTQYTFVTHQSVFTATSGGGDFGNEYGSAVYRQEEVVNGIRLGQATTTSAFTSGTVKLFGIKRI